MLGDLGEALPDNTSNASARWYGHEASVKFESPHLSQSHSGFGRTLF